MSTAAIAQGSVDVNVRPCAEPCQKCGSDDIYRRFIPKGGEVPHEGYDKCASKYGTGQCHSWTATRDHLHHHCRCCGFAWQGLPLKKGKAGPNVEFSGAGKRSLHDSAGTQGSTAQPPSSGD